MNRIKLFLIIIAIAFFYYGCDSSGKTIHIDQETKEYCLFKQGSYWVYQDSATLETDSIVIKTNPYFTSGTGGGSTDAKEIYTFDTEIYSNNIFATFFSSIFPGMEAEFDTQKPIWFFLNSASSNIINYYYTYYTYHNGDIGSYYNSNIFFDNDFYSQYVSFYENYMLNDISYQNVKVFNLSEDSMPASTTTKLYWAKHIGLIRIEDYSDTTKVSVKNLIRYSVENYEN